MLHPGVAAGLRGAILWLAAFLFWTPAQAQELFSVSGVQVDVTAESADAAREKALLEGQRKALEQLAAQIAPGRSVAQLSDEQITNMVHDFEIQSERISDVRYIGTLSFRFDAGQVQQTLGAAAAAGSVLPAGSAGTASATVAATLPAGTGMQPAPAAGSLLVLPLLSGPDGAAVDTRGDWYATWARAQRQVRGPLQLLLPDHGIAGFDVTQIAAGDPAQISAVAARYGAQGVLVPELRLMRDSSGAQQLVLVARRYGQGGTMDTYRDSFLVRSPNLLPLFDEAAARVMARVASGAGAVAAAPAASASTAAGRRLSDVFGSGQAAQPQAGALGQQQASAGGLQILRVSVPVAQLSDWVAVRQRLGRVPAVRGTEVKAMLRNEARIDLAYIGDPAQLMRDLEQQGLGLSQTAEGWWVLRPL